MVNGAFNFSAAAIDLAFERPHTRLQLGNGQAIEVFVHQRGERVVGPGPQDVVQVHDTQR